MQGIMVQSQSIANNQKAIDVRDLSTGVYILRMHTDKGFVMRKMIKQ